MVLVSDKADGCGRAADWEVMICLSLTVVKRVMRDESIGNYWSINGMGYGKINTQNTVGHCARGNDVGSEFEDLTDEEKELLYYFRLQDDEGKAEVLNKCIELYEKERAWTVI